MSGSPKEMSFHGSVGAVSTFKAPLFIPWRAPKVEGITRSLHASLPLHILELIFDNKCPISAHIESSHYIYPGKIIIVDLYVLGSSPLDISPNFKLLPRRGLTIHLKTDYPWRYPHLGV